MRATSYQWIAGVIVMAVATAGAAVSAPWSERTFARPEAMAGDATHKRDCITMDGKHFPWNYPNAPFGAQSCSD